MNFRDPTGRNLEITDCGANWIWDASLQGPCPGSPGYGGSDPCIGNTDDFLFGGPGPFCLIVPPPPPPPPVKKLQPKCFAQLKDRPVNDPAAQRFGGVHTFWWVQGDIDGVLEQFIISAGPQTPKGSTTGYLNASATLGSDNGSGDNSRQHLDWDSGLSSSLCNQVDDMIEVAENFPKWKILYYPVGALGFGGPNSNSAAHYFAVAGGFFTVTPPATAYGWNSPVPIP